MIEWLAAPLTLLLLAFGSSPPKAPPPPKEPDDTAAGQAAADARERARMRRGRSGSIFAGRAGEGNLTGQGAMGSPIGTAAPSKRTYGE